MALTEKMKSFCREYVSNGGNGTQAYLTAYDSNNEAVAANESSLLLKRDEVKEYLATITKPLEDTAMDEGEKIRSLIWERIAVCQSNGDDAAIARYTDQLNRLSGRYQNINVNKTDATVNLNGLDLNALKNIAE